MKFLQSSAGRFALLLLAALVWRCDTFGHPGLHGDEAFYQTVGIAMHHGALPYVDVWDRKPFGLFAIYWLIAGISESPIAYQLAATLFAAGTAWAITALARQWTSAQGALLAGLIYIVMLGPLQGYGGQSPVFYDLFIALAALLTFRALPVLNAGEVPRSMLAAMLLAGLGVTVKTSAVFEAVFLGLIALAALWSTQAARGSVMRTGLVWAMIGALPSLTIAAAYWSMGYWPEFWHAMVTSNLAKSGSFQTSVMRFGILILFLSPLLVLAGFGLLWHQQKVSRRFVLLWLVAAFAGLLAVPNFYLHYAIPILVPLCLAASTVLARNSVGRISAVAVVLLAAIASPPLQFADTARAREAMAQLVAILRAHSADRGLATFEAPAQLYPLTGQPFMTPLVFPTHLSALSEKDVSHLSTLAEMRRVLAQAPGVVVTAQPIHNGPVNLETQQLILAYVAHNCHLIGMRRIYERTQSIDLAVWGDCQKPR